MAGKTECLSRMTFLFDVPPSVMERLCKIIDSGDGDFGWRGLAARILPDWLEVRYMEKVCAQGKSPARELLWSWAQKNKTVGDLLEILEEMGHQRAVQLFLPQGVKSTVSAGKCCSFLPKENNLLHESHHKMKNAETCEFPDEFHCLSSNVPNGGSEQMPIISFSDIVMGTRNFHQDLKIGEGTFSEVYKGVIGNQIFAVKLFKQGKQTEWKKLWKLFMSEIQVLSLYHHPNILALSGYCSEEGKYCLVYPYMSNGSLFHRLHCPDTRALLPWQVRLRILKGTARAVQHLHTAQPCCVISGNITSANILLDEHFEPQLSDFGMACLRPHSVNDSCTISLDTSSRSILGYLPEEYIRDGKLSVKLDVYSLGVVIMEILTARRAVQDGPKYTRLKDMLCNVVEESGGVDACLRFLDEQAGSWPPSVSLGLFRLALECTAWRPKNRPTTSAVLQVLSEMRPVWCRSEDQPHTLKDLEFHKGLVPSLPEENDEMQGFGEAQLDRASPSQHRTSRAQGGPCECSLSEIICIGPAAREDGSAEKPGPAALPKDPWDLYCSWPVECSCTVAENGKECEECRANGFSFQTGAAKDDAAGFSVRPDIVENAAKEKFKDRIEQYNKGLLNTKELLSMKELN
nr:PREDICTED: interleukin-1 receptor-associated kinase 3 isoform X1 [Lepisosteus oculatus]XP_015208218.1 PREDICTED: interleukin-1 receptor-associated kinase 3 isoform X1 [Lepisosteus oculatus]XP_015208219.1 PREDICTED: interleukin-1 receptor-associated kinase 3 isoform X1 [Lepisosteus oculatus]